MFLSPLFAGLLLAQTPPAMPTPSAPSPAPGAASVPAQLEPPKAIQEVPKAPRPIVTKVEDNGLLEHNYFGAEIPFSSRLGVDALWIKTGLSLKDKRITYGSWDVKVLKPGREQKHLQRAADLARLIPDALMPQMRAAFQGVADWQLGGSGDFRLEARVVDANLPNTASKLVLGWLAGKDNLENVTWDMKVMDVVSGEVVLAFHHRMVKVNTLGSLDSSLRDWAAAFPKKLLEVTR